MAEVMSISVSCRKVKICAWIGCKTLPPSVAGVKGLKVLLISSLQAPTIRINLLPLPASMLLDQLETLIISHRSAEQYAIHVHDVLMPYYDTASLHGKCTIHRKVTLAAAIARHFDEKLAEAITDPETALDRRNWRALDGLLGEKCTLLPGIHPSI